MPDTHEGWPLKKRRWLSRLTSTQSDRATRHCISLALDLDALTPKASPESAEIARKFIRQAQVFLDEGNIEGAWHCLNNAGRRLVDLKDPEERLNQARVLLIEAEKVSKWRRKAIEKLLCDEHGDVQAVGPNLKDAIKLRDEYYENRYHRIAMQREQLRNLVTIAGFALTGILIMLAYKRIDDLPPWDWRLLLLVVFFALTGASFSAFRSLATATEATIPDLALSLWMTLGRTMLGACLGVAVYALLTSGIINFGLEVDAPKVLAVAFAAGFSERLVVRAVEAVTGEGKTE